MQTQLVQIIAPDALDIAALLPPGITARCAATPSQADRLVPDVLLAEVEGDLDVLERAQRAWPGIPIVLMAGPGSIRLALEGMRRGAFHYLRRPIEAEELVIILERALEASAEAQSRLPQSDETAFSRHGLIGRSHAMRTVFDLIDQVARADTTVLIQGESGTGKELVARAIHTRSPRRKGRFVAVNCGAIPRDLMESELFGHVQGAFTGATSTKRGLIEEGEGGTVFLDEISELDPSLQVKLTRVLQEHEVRPVGGTVDQKVDVRFIASSNRDLARMVEQGRFREDLFFRLQVYPIELAPLRQRQEDIPDLVLHYLSVFNARLGRDIRRVDKKAMVALEAFAWPGNVRELANMLERAILLEKGDSLTLESFPGLQDERSRSGFWEPPVEFLSYKEYMDGVTERAQHRYMTKVMTRFKGNVSEAAKHTGLKRETVHRMLKRLRISAKDYRK